MRPMRSSKLPPRLALPIFEEVLHEFFFIRCSDLKDEDGHVYARLSLSPKARVKKNGGTYLLPDDAIPGQPSLQFYNDKGDVVWTAPSAAQFLPAR